MSTSFPQDAAACFPSMAAYLSGLPDGLDSYPDCQVKAVFLLSVLEDFPLRSVSGGAQSFRRRGGDAHPALLAEGDLERSPVIDRLPPVLADLVRSPPPSTAWLRQVHFRCILRAILDQYFKGDEAAMVAWSYGAQKKLLGGPLYRVMFALLSPERVVQLAPQRWGHFHRGLSMQVDIRPHQVEGLLRYPPHLYLRFDHDLSLAGIRAVIELAGGRDVRLEILETSPTQGRSRLTWR